MRNCSSTGLLVFAACALVPASAAAQEGATGAASTTAQASTSSSAGSSEQVGPEGGRYGLSFGFPTAGGATLGGAYVLNDNAAIRLEVGLDFQFTNPQLAGFSMEGGYRIYFLKIARLAPFFQPSLYLGKPAADTGFNSFTLGLSGLIGAEYFFAKEFSVGASTGLALNISDTFRTVKFGTGTTAAFATFYFR